MKVNKNKKQTGIKEVARRANVAIATVDRVIHNRPGVSPRTKEKIEKIIQDLDYQPNVFARRLASRKVLEFATLLPKISKETDFWEAPLKGILQAESEISQNGIKITKFFYSLNNRQSFKSQAKLVIDSKPDGILLAPSFVEESIAFVKVCQRLNIPYVFINSDIPGQSSLCYVGSDLFHSGYMGGHLINYLVPSKGTVLLVNIAKELEQHHELRRKEEGIQAYFERYNKKELRLVKIDIQQTTYESVSAALLKALRKHKDISLIFVPNSRVGTVARFLEEKGKQKTLLLGYDFIKDNLRYLENGTIDFLICERPQEQGYRGIMTLYQHLVFDREVENVFLMSIDIISRENSRFYRN